MSSTVSDFGERRLLARIRERLGKPEAASAGLVVGIGDDAAIVQPARNARTVLTTDAQVEGVHFERRFSRADEIGARALTVNLSDLAAMGARPRWALVSLILPDALPVADVDGIVDGIAGEAARHAMVVVGGNLARSPGPVIVDITAVGEAGPRQAITRSGGRPGDELYVSGAIGGAAAGLEMLARTRASGAEAPDARTGAEHPCVARYRRPQARVRLGLALAQARAARAAIDLSDGLAAAARQLAEASGCGVEIDAAALPLDPDAREWWAAAKRDPVAAALDGGDDYELLFAVARTARGRLRHARTRVADPAITRIGVLTKEGAGCLLVREGRREPLAEGFGHWDRS